MTKAPSERARTKRGHERASYDATVIHEILDAMPVCHVAYVLDGAPVVTPTIQWREGDRVYWHGSSASRMLKKSTGNQVNLAVTILDGMVMARSGFHHSVNYRSVMLFGEAEIVTGREEKILRLRNFMEGLFPGRWDMLRPINDKEIKATTVLSMAIDEASAKVRPGMPIDDEDDYDLPIWAGVIPLKIQTLAPLADPRNLDGLSPPDHVTQFTTG